MPLPHLPPARFIPFLFTEGGIRYLVIASQVLNRKHYTAWFRSIFELYFHGDPSLVFHVLRLLLLRELEQLSAQPPDDLNTTNTLFRATTAFTSFLTIVSESLGHSYLLNIVATYVGRLVLHGDPSASAKQLFDIYYNSIFLNHLMDSVAKVPMPLRQIYSLVAQGVRKIFPKCEQNAVANMFFLRFVCPALLTPAERSLWTSPMSQAVKGALMHSSKALQSSSVGSAEPLPSDPQHPRLRISDFISLLIDIPSFEPTLEFESRPSSALILISPYFKEFSDIFASLFSSTHSWILANPTSQLLPLDNDTLNILSSFSPAFQVSRSSDTLN